MSSGSDSDDDYVPEEPEKVSEEESADEETDVQFEKELEHKTNKRKSVQSVKGKKRLKIKNGTKEVIPDTKEESEQAIVEEDQEKEKKRQDDLWAKFLEGTDTKPKPKNDSTNAQPVNKNIEVKNEGNSKNSKETNDKDREKRIFEFAGETVVVENNTIKEKIKTPESASTVKKLGGPSRSSGGLSNLLGQLNKNNKLSTLEKSKLDWNTYKKEEGIEEEIVNHNKGKAGYLDRRDFLDRTDVRQYEIERDLRMSRRSNR